MLSAFGKVVSNGVGMWQSENTPHNQTSKEKQEEKETEIAQFAFDCTSSVIINVPKFLDKSLWYCWKVAYY